VGNPLLDAIDAQLNRGELLDDFLKRHDLPHKPIIGLLPGSRRQEIKGLLPMMLRLKPHFPEYQFLISAAPGISEDYYEQFMDDDKNNNLIHNDTYQMVKHADACIVASGTAALETALIGTPQVAVYKVGGGILAHAVGRLVIKVKWATLVNLIMQKEIIKELLQKDFTFSKLKKELKAILPNGEKRANLLNQYQELYTKMGNTGASARAAESMVKRLKEDLK